MFAVNFWGSHPELNNDDCWYGYDYATLEEAVASFNAPVEMVAYCPARDVAYVEIDAEDADLARFGIASRYRKNPKFRKSRSDSEWRNEIAMQAGMMGGCEAYNDHMEAFADF